MQNVREGARLPIPKMLDAEREAMQLGNDFSIFNIAVKKMSFPFFVPSFLIVTITKQLNNMAGCQLVG